MPESQKIEWKESWRDEYLKWICGFANAQGGTLYIGKDDKGEVVGVADWKKLLEDIPNKVRDILGIVVEVNRHEKKGKTFLEIIVEAYTYPISYKGQYHIRSGSTKQELKGAALDRFLLQKQGKKWDGVPVPKVSVSDLKPQAIDLFKSKALKSGRLSEEALNGNTEVLIDNLRLTEGDYLKRAAVLLFHADPERFVTGAYIKIGYFQGAELIYQDEIHGNLIEQSDKALDLLLTKYLKAYISYEGIQRVEKYLFPKEALREALLNAIVHKDYASGIPIQIKVYDDRITFWNQGELPDNWTVETLKLAHPSNPFNPDIANVFFRAGLIESWGRGIEKITYECKAHDLPAPEIQFDASFMLSMDASKLLKKLRKKNDGVNDGEASGKLSEMRRRNVGETSEKILQIIEKNKYVTIAELSEKIGISDRSIERNLQKLQESQMLRRIGAAKGGHWEIIE